MRANYSFIPQENFDQIMQEYEPNLFDRNRQGVVVSNHDEYRYVDYELLQLIFFDPYLQYQAQRLYEEHDRLEKEHPLNIYYYNNDKGYYETRPEKGDLVVHSNQGKTYLSCMQFGKEYYEELLDYRDELYEYLKNDKSLIRKMEYSDDEEVIPYMNLNRIHYRGYMIKLEGVPYQNIPDEIEEPDWDSFPFNCGSVGVKVYDKTDFDFPMALYEMLECFNSYNHPYYEDYLDIKHGYDYGWKHPYDDLIGDLFTDYRPEDSRWGSDIVSYW